ncbi:DUF551 domain-containing protein [Salmonella enterica]|uniref:DUF551 domain-containing protein n=1 Tax=Salmonella enterica TaxID=28901 RepID=UPI003CF9F821
MSTLTKEWLLKTIAELEEERDATPGAVNEDAANALAAMKLALASLEAEPVAWLLSGGGAKNHVSFDSGNAYADPLREVTPLYTAPPAPVSVPDAMEMDDDFDSSFEHGKAVGWNAYRAAMLQSFGNSEQLNSPVILDGWIPVSDRMPNDKDFVWCWGYVSGWTESDGFEAYYDATRNKWWTVDDETVRKVTHWMPLPAAPQQEVN